MRGCCSFGTNLHERRLDIFRLPAGRDVGCCGSTGDHAMNRNGLLSQRVPLAGRMSERALRECGWRANSLGDTLHVDELCTALQRDQPRLMWINVPSIPDVDRFIASFNVLFDTAISFNAALVVAGEALTPEIHRLLSDTTYCDNFRQLETIAKTLYQATTSA